MSVDQYIEQLNPPVQAIAAALCEIVTTTSDDLCATIKWNVPVYSIERDICSVIAHRAHVNLQFFRGAHLADHAVLSGDGKNMRHLKFTSLEEIQHSQIRRLLEQAIALDSGN